MSRIVVIGAGGRVGRAAVAEARRRGHEVTAVVRDPARHRAGVGDGVHLVRGDVTDAGDVARVAREHDAVIGSGYDPGVPAEEFFAGACGALVDGLERAGVGRLLVVGLASVLATESGVALMDTPGYPQEYRGFYLAHAGGNAVLRAATTAVDWLVLSPAGDFAPQGGRTGRYRLAAADAASRISHADFAVALLDEIDAPRLHRRHVGVETAR